MKLSLVFELLLIFILLAFAAQAKSTRKQKNNNKKGIQTRNEAEKPEDNTINKYCKCQESHCNCCRDFDVPLVNLNGPGCASLTYLSGDKMAVSLSFGRKVITNRTLSSKKPSPVCMPLPGGISKFCGRVYNIARAGEEFRACLGLELQSKSAVEAAVRVSCFKFGPRGVTSEQADPLPLVPQNERDEDDDDDDDDDVDFDLGDDDDDDDDDDDAANDVESADYTGFSLLSEDLLGGLFGSSGNKKHNKNRKKQAPAPTPSTSTTQSTTTRRPRPSRRPSKKPTRSTTPRTVPSTPTTIRVRPSGNRRPTRKPARKPTRKPTTVPASSVLSTLAASSTEPITVEMSSTTQNSVKNIQDVMMSTAQDQTFEPIAIVTQRPASTLAATTAKSVTNFADPGLEMSLAHITGQLSVMPAPTPISPDTGKESDLVLENAQMKYEKIETITKVPSKIPLVTPVPDSDEMIQVLQKFDSEEKDAERAEESRAVSYGFYDGISLKQKKKGRHDDFDYLDVLNLDQIGKTVGEELGIFGKNKKHNKDNKVKKVRDGKNDDDYSLMGLDSIESLIGLNNGKQNKKNRRRQNKMMRGEWSQPEV